VNYSELYTNFCFLGDSVGKPIRDALHPLKDSILHQSLSNLFELVDSAFVQHEKKSGLIVEKLNLAMKSEFQSVNWDADLQKEMEGNITKCLKYISVKVEQQLQLNEETLRLSGRVSAKQAANYQVRAQLKSSFKCNPNHPRCSVWRTTLPNTGLTLLNL